MKRPFRLAVLATVAVFLVLAGHRFASAHAGFVSAQPEPGAELGTAPGVVVLRFSEPLNVELSQATVRAPGGRSFEAAAASSREIRVPLASGEQGVYVVEWRTVSTVDGHTLHGSFEFGVGVSPGPQAEGSTEAGPRAADLLLAVGRGIEDAALLLALGMLLVRRLALRPPALRWAHIRLRPVLVLALLSGTAVVLGEAVAAAPSPSVGAVVTYLTTGLAGVARLGRPLLEATALVATFVAPGAVAGPVVLALVAIGAAGHAAVVRPVGLGVGVEAVHLVSAGLWGGGILALATLRPSGGWRGEEGRKILERFTPVALWSFTITVATGTARGIQEVGSLTSLLTSTYGVALIFKVLGVALMVQLSILAWRRLIGSPRVEAAVAVSVIGIAALLAAYPLPPSRVEAAEGRAQAATASSRSALPRKGDLTLGGDAGQVLVGLTVRPGQPGPNQILLYLLPLEGERAADSLEADLRVEGSSLDVQRCGPACRSATAMLKGGESVQVRVAGATGGTASFRLPDLPALQADVILREMMTRMHELQTYRQDEMLSSGLAAVRSRYAFEVPDRMRSEITRGPGEGSETVLVGSTRYRRSSQGDWQVERGGPPPRVPSFIWDFFRPFVAARVIGSETVDGSPARIVAFFGRSGDTPVWFRLWIDRTGLVPRAEMRAQGHFMDHRYYDFDAPLAIRPPDAKEQT